MTSENIELLKEIQGIDFFKPFFELAIYEDGREITCERPYVIKTGLEKSAAGSSFVQYQGSVVSCRVVAKAGFYDPKQCLRFHFKRDNQVSKREFDFVRAVLSDFARRNVFIDPKSLIFDTEYQIQLFVTLTIKTCDGFLLGAALTAVNSALENTRYPTMTANELDDEEEMDDDAPSKRLMFRRDRFRAILTKMNRLKIEDVPQYTGFLIYEGDDPANPKFLYDPNEELVNMLQKRIDIVTGRDGLIYFWQNSTFSSINREFRREIVKFAREHHERIGKILNKVCETGSADSETS